MEKTYQPEQIETRWYERWEADNRFAPSGRGKPFSIMIPPPNVTGSLHMGHAFQDTIMDTLTRWKRMQGNNTLCPVAGRHRPRRYRHANAGGAQDCSRRGQDPS